MDNKAKQLRDGIFSLNTRRFGSVAELMIKKMYSLNKSDNLAYDLKTSQNEKIEVKFSTVLKKCTSNINSQNLLSSIISSRLENRMLSFDKSKETSFDCNIQQIKTKEFKYLYYGCFFEDKIMICKIESSQIFSDPEIMYSDHQHRGNVGEGQFHINNKTINNHINKYLNKWITYEDLYKLFS